MAVVSTPLNTLQTFANIFMRKGSSQGSPESKSNLQLPNTNGLSAEDAYWASYSAVQGTADSTIPSPRVETRTPRHLRRSGLQDNGIQDEEDGYFPPGEERILGAYVPDVEKDRDSDSSSSHAEQLARALFPVLSLQDYQEANSSVLAVDGHGLSKDGLISSASDSAPRNSASKSVGGLLSPPLSNENEVQQRPTSIPESSNAEDANMDAALKESICGLYKLWGAQRRSRSPSTEAEHRREFLALVERSIS